MYEDYTQERCDGEVSKAFGNGLASIILCEFPIASIVAIVLGSKAVRSVDNLKNVCGSRSDLSLNKKSIPARILGLIGKIVGIVMTVVYTIIIPTVIILAIMGELGSYGSL